MEHCYTRLEWLVGSDNLVKLHNSAVAVFGCGGVGSFAVEALARSGIGRLVLIDGDQVAISNINRQLVALHSTVGKRKVTVAKERCLDINPQIQVECHNIFYKEGSYPGFIQNLQVDYVVDAIDMMSAKLNLIEICHRENIPIISAMGFGNKVDPSQIKLADINKTHTCPLARIIRKELRTRKINKHQVVFSTEEPCHAEDFAELTSPASCGFVPSVAGLFMASYVVRELIKK